MHNWFKIDFKGNIFSFIHFQFYEKELLYSKKGNEEQRLVKSLRSYVTSKSYDYS